MTDRYIGTDELAQMIPVGIDTLSAWRRRGYGPRSIKVGRKIAYRVSDVQAWIAAQDEATAVEGNPTRKAG